MVAIRFENNLFTRFRFPFAAVNFQSISVAFGLHANRCAHFNACFEPVALLKFKTTNPRQLAYAFCENAESNDDGNKVGAIGKIVFYRLKLALFRAYKIFARRYVRARLF